MSDSQADRFLQLAADESNRLSRHLLVAAALREVLSEDPVIVGGTAEEYWTADEYHETDLDMCVPLSNDDEAALKRIGFQHRGRHWERKVGEHWVAVEFPASRIDGSERVIGLDDLYLDRLRAATMSRREGVEYHSAQAVAAARYDDIDWKYVENRIREIGASVTLVGGEMKKINSRIRRRVRKRIKESF